MGRKNEVIDSMSEAELEQAKSTKIIKWWPGCSQVAKQKHLERVDARLAEITEQHPDERVAWRSTDGPEHAGVVTFHRLSDDQTRVTLQLDWEPEGFVETAGAALQLDDLQVARDLQKFKEIIEAQRGESGAWRGDVDRAPDSTGR